MTVIRIAFEFAMGLLAVVMVLMAVTMVAYILKVTVEEILNKDSVTKLIERIKK